MGFFSPTKSPKAASSKPAAAGKPLHLLQYDERTKKFELGAEALDALRNCLLYTSPSPRDATLSRMPSSA